jgi:hypothetical protein
MSFESWSSVLVGGAGAAWLVRVGIVKCYHGEGGRAGGQEGREEGKRDETKEGIEG